MRLVRRIFVAALLLILVGGVFAAWRFRRGVVIEDRVGPADWSLTPPIEGATPVSTAERMPGIYPAGSRVADTKAFGGFGPCDNWPKDLGDKTWGEKGKIALVAFPDEPVGYFKYQGVGVRLVNRTGKRAAFEARDSCLYLIQEARDEKGVWREIESPPAVNSHCGNTFHRVFLDSDQYWEFRARRYDGPFKTKIRFRLDIAGEQGGESIVSNDFDGAIAPAQVRRAPAHADIRRAMASPEPNKEAVATLIELIESKVEDDELRSTLAFAADSLGGFGPAAKEALPTLRKAMDGDNPWLRVSAAQAVWRIGGDEVETVKTIVAVLDAADVNNSRLAAAFALKELGPAAKAGVPALCRALPTGDERFRRDVAETLGTLRMRPDLCVPALRTALDDADWFVRSNAASALGHFGDDAKLVRPRIEAALRDPVSFVRIAAAGALCRIDGKVDRGLPVLITELEGKGDWKEASPVGAAEEFAKLGPIVVLSIVVTAFAALIVYDVRLVAEADRLIAELDRTDPGWRDVSFSESTLSPDRDSAVVIQRVNDRIPNWAEENRNDRDLYLAIKYAPPPRLLPKEDASRLEGMMKRCATALALATTLKDIPDGRFVPKKNGEVPDFADEQNYLWTEELLQYACFDFLERREFAAAWDVCRAASNVGKSLQAGDSGVGSRRGEAAETAIDLLQRFLAHAEASESDLAAMQANLAKENEVDLYFPYLAPSCRDYLRWLDEMLEGKIDFAEWMNLGRGKERIAALDWRTRLVHRFPRYLLLDAKRASLETMTAVRRLKNTKGFARREAMEKLAEGLCPEGSEPEQCLGWHPQIQSKGTEERFHGLLGCAEVGLAAERYRLRFGRWPASPETLIESGLLARVPEDPWDGGPFRFRVSADGIVVHSVCPSRIYDGTALDDFEEPHFPNPGNGGPIEFRLWNADRRHQPSPEK